MSEKQELQKYAKLNKKLNADENEFTNEIIKKKCPKCNFEYFTHYPNKTICDCCRFKDQHYNQWID